MIYECFDYYCEACDKKIKKGDCPPKYCCFIYIKDIDEFQINGMCINCYKNETDEEERQKKEEELKTEELVCKEKIDNEGKGG